VSSEIKLSGFKEFENKLNNLPAKLSVKADAFVQRAAQDWALLAARNAPVKTNTLRGRIQAVPKGQMNAEVLSPVRYSPYVEWGTGERVVVPVDLVNYALKFKTGKRTIGRYPHAYFFIHKQGIAQALFAKLNNLLNTPQ